MQDYYDRLKAVIYELHGSLSEHVGTHEIREPDSGKPVWSGTIEEFRLVGKPDAPICFAWEHTCGKNEEELRYVAVLCGPKVRTPREALQKVLANDYH